jgi:hypothetical protein
VSTISHPILGPYAQLADLARLHYGRIWWRNPAIRESLLKHWTDPRHPYAERFTSRYRPLVERVLSASEADDAELDAELRGAGESLRTVTREIPPVFGSFFSR